MPTTTALPTSSSSPWLGEPDTDEADSRALRSYAPLVGDRTSDVLVVGAGITGLSAAAMLKQEGLSVVVLEARHLGAAATGHTSAKLSLLQGTLASSLDRSLGPDAVRDHLAAHREGLEWATARAARVECGFERRTAVTYATDGPDGASARTVRAEADVLRAAGLPVELGTDIGLPFEVSEAVRLPGQAQFDPVPYLRSLAAEVHGNGSAVHEGTRVRSASWAGPIEVRTPTGRVRAPWVVLATGMPVLDRGLFFARAEPSRSYSLALRVEGDLPDGMYLSADAPTRSVRTATHDGERLLLVGGNGHRVGTAAPMLRHERELAAWAADRWPVREVTHRWSAQDYSTEDGLPFVGPLSPLSPRALVAFGFAKWGMTGGTAAAIAVRDRILGHRTPWADRMRADRLPRSARAVTTLARANAAVARYMVSGWVRPDVPGGDLADGEGRVEIGPRGKVARCRVGGRLHERSAVCPHLGGIVTWNDAESSWDCPLHASRFAPDGTVLEGPSTESLDDPPGLASVVRPRS